MSDIKVGDVVVLKSGGPKMTVAKLENFGGVSMAVCDWFEKDKPMSSRFPMHSLQHVPRLG